MKKVFIFLLLLTGLAAEAQVYGNDWIDFSKTYYKFKVGATGLYRINQATLTANGLGTAAAEDFQLWRNGVEVPIYTSVASGPLSATDYIEFWGKMNDGKPDKDLYRNPAYQLNDNWSLETDTASYFLVVNTGGTNLRLTPTANNVATNTLPAEPYFLYKTGAWFKNQINGGYAVNVGSYMYSSSYDRGEGWTSANITANATLTTNLSNLFAYTGTAPAPLFNIIVSGTATNQRRYKVVINSDSVTGKQSDYFNVTYDTATFSQSLLSSGTASVAVTNITAAASDRLVIHKFEITYARQFNFGGASNFEFTLPASGAAKFLQITGFNYGSTPPVLYDLTNNKRYVGDVSTAGVVKIVVEPSATAAEFVLVREEASNISNVTSMQSRTFTNFSVDTNQGDYIIITNPILFNGPGGTNPVENYRAYRSSVAGGGYNAITVMIDDITDQFGYGIKKNPLAIRNFLQYSRDNFNYPPKFVFLIGKAVDYSVYRFYESNPAADQLNLVPTFGSPASDVMLSSDPGSSKPEIPIGRLSVINGQEVADYLQKVKQFELAQETPSPYAIDKAWMKNVVHVVGASEPNLQLTLYNYMATYRQIIQDTLFGGHVTTFAKSSPNPVDQINSEELDRLFAEGITLITYFGHSGSTSLEFNLNNPDQYNNTGKYPLFIALGCNAGNFYSFDLNRFTRKGTVSEQFVLAPNKGTIGFIASSHFGIPDYLHLYNQKFYESAGVKNYGKPVGEIISSAISDIFAYTTQDDFYARATCEESTLNGDPAVKLNPHDKPDYDIEPDMVEINPSFVSVADRTFNLKAKFLNLGKAINKDIVIDIKQQNAAGLTRTIYRDTIPGIRYSDSVNISINIDPIRDKGTNKIIVTVDDANDVDELFESNNSVTKEFEIFDDAARPVFPYEFSIVSSPNFKFYVSTTNPFSALKTYRFEIDTTEKFNSPVKQSATQTSTGGVIEFNPSLLFTDSTVYYWRVASVPATGNPVWTGSSSFLYLGGSSKGVNQSHYYQQLKSTYERMTLDTQTRALSYTSINNDIYIRNGVWISATGVEGDVVVNLNSVSLIRSFCTFNVLLFNVIDGNTFKPWKNAPAGLYGSLPQCDNTTKRSFNFEFPNDSAGRRKAMEFIRMVPQGNYIVLRNTLRSSSTPDYAAQWALDSLRYGSTNTLYTELKNDGFAEVDSFNRLRVFAFVFKKSTPSFTPKWAFSNNQFDVMTLSATLPTKDSIGFINSPVFGPAKQWQSLKWEGRSIDSAAGDNPSITVIGIRNDRTADTLYTGITQNSFDLTSVDASTYPFLQLRMRDADSIYFTPAQLKYWRVYFTPMPEGSVAPNILFSMKDSFEMGEPIDFRLAFKNISDISFDSIKLKITITDKNNVSHVITVPKLKPIGPGDTVQVHFPIDSRLYSGMNTLFVDVNPDNDQPEQYHFNNFIYKKFFVFGDTLNPTLDVTFDNMHIVNGDIVSAKPLIVINLNDESRFNRLTDTSLVTVQVRDPAGNLHPYYFNTDSLQFIPASATGENKALINFHPYFAEDGDYELIVKGHDESNNKAGAFDYRIGFSVINKPMISNMLNYPNPFTSSTAFVFTITGSQVPQNLKIQILTITGKIVREITKEELGPLRVGRNITEFKWDGTDQYGRLLGNGVYLYRVTTNLNGKSLDKYTGQGDKTDKYFNNGYGKMYLMR
jgi:hypothetical protein